MSSETPPLNLSDSQPGSNLRLRQSSEHSIRDGQTMGIIHSDSESGGIERLCQVVNKHTNFDCDYFAKRNEDDGQIRCDVCYDHEYYAGDELVMCDNCNCSVHLKCYKNDSTLEDGIPEGDWFCQRCQ